MIFVGRRTASKGSCLVRERFIEGPVAVSSKDFPILTAAMPITRGHRNFALTVITFVFGIVLLVAPFASIPLARVGPFIPVVQTVMCIVDLTIAAILFGQYSLRSRPALLAVASGYVFSGLFAFLQTLAFPGAYSASGLIGDGISSASWLFVLWHVSFYSGILIYALSNDMDDTSDSAVRSRAAVIGMVVTLICGLTAGLTWIVTERAMYLPTLNTALHIGLRQTSLSSWLNAFLWLGNAATLLALYVRRRTLLDLWLMVTLAAWWPHFVLSFFLPVVQFSVGWYVARVFALLSSFTLLILLLTESMALYARLANNIRLLGRERAERLTSLDAATGAMAHEVRQPLGAVMNYSATAAMLLKKEPPTPNVMAAIDCLDSIDESIDTAESRIASVRKLFDKAPHQNPAVQLNNVTEHTLALLEHDLRANRVEVSAEYKDDLPSVKADRTQLQQVIFNVIRNSIEAMVSSNNDRRLRLITGFNGSTVSLYVQDSGPGISAENQVHIFDAFFTTKRTGMGLGLAICRAIIEDHGGKLRLAKTGPHGTSFEITLPVSLVGENSS